MPVRKHHVNTKFDGCYGNHIITFKLILGQKATFSNVSVEFCNERLKKYIKGSFKEGIDKSRYNTSKVSSHLVLYVGVKVPKINFLSLLTH